MPDTIRNPVEWVVDELREVADGFGQAGRSVQHTSTHLFSRPLEVSHITVGDLKQVLAKGFDDFMAYRTDIIFLIVVYPIISLLVIAASFRYELIPLVFPIVSGSAILGPFAGVFLYEMSRRRELSLERQHVENHSWANALSVFRSHNFGAIMMLGGLLVVMYLVWLVFAWGIYQATTGPTRAVLEVHGTATQQPHVVTLERAERRTLVKLNLPQTFGATPQIALYLVRAEKQVANTPGGVQLFGLGAGPRAVGSVAIDQVDFGPSALRVSQKQRASYSFYSRSDFNRVVVEIVRVARAAGEIKVSLARSTPLDITLTRGTWVGKKEPLTWDGMNGANRVSTGPHMLQVRAWLNGQDARDWVAAWSPSAVVVAE